MHHRVEIILHQSISTMSVSNGVPNGIGRDITIRMQEVAFQPRQTTSEYPFPYFPYKTTEGARSTSTETRSKESTSIITSPTRQPPPSSLAQVLTAIETAGSPALNDETRIDKLCRKLQRSFQEKNMMLSEISYLKQQLKDVSQSATSTIEAEREAMDQLVESNVRAGVLACIWCIKTQVIKMMAAAFNRWKSFPGHEEEEAIGSGEDAFWTLLKNSVRSKLKAGANGTASGSSGGGGNSPNAQLLRFMHAASKAAGLGGNNIPFHSICPLLHTLIHAITCTVTFVLIYLLAHCLNTPGSTMESFIGSLVGSTNEATMRSSGGGPGDTTPHPHPDTHP